MSWSSLSLLRNCASYIKKILEQTISRYIGTILTHYYSHFFISIFVVSLSHSCVKKRGSESVEQNERRQSPSKFHSSKSTSSTEQGEKQPHELTPKSTVDWEAPAKPSPSTAKSLNMRPAIGSGRSVTAQPVDFTCKEIDDKRVQSKTIPVDGKKKKPLGRMFVFEPSASFLNSERKRDESHEDNTIHDAPSLVNVKISRASDELISLSLKGKDDRKKQKAATPPPPAMPKEVKAEELLVLQPTIGSIHEELPTSKKKIIRTDKTLPSAET